MTRSLLSSIVCIGSVLLTLAGAARAQDASLPAPPQVQLEHEGAAGMWFRMDRARLILADVKAYRALDTTLVPKLELRVELAKLHVEHLEAALAASERAEASAVESLEAAVRGRREAEEARDSVFSGQPLIWGLSGALVTAIAVALLQ